MHKAIKSVHRNFVTTSFEGIKNNNKELKTKH